jgi:hypothetical protein
MSGEPIIAFGQQPCGFLPRRFLVAKIRTARRLQAELGGRVVYFCHDSDHDPRETRTILRHRTTGQPAPLNFAVVSKLQRKFSPLYAKRIAADWHARTLGQLPNYVDHSAIELFRKTSAETVADFDDDFFARCAFTFSTSAWAVERTGTASVLGPLQTDSMRSEAASAVKSTRART